MFSVDIFSVMQKNKKYQRLNNVLINLKYDFIRFSSIEISSSGWKIDVCCSRPTYNREAAPSSM